MSSDRSLSLHFERTHSYWRARFEAMASPCEILIDTELQQTASETAKLVSAEAWRIEQKFSRYREDNLIHRINHAEGETITLDEETAAFIDYAETCYRISDGLFDITSGVLRRAWQFTANSGIPDINKISNLLPLVGWDKADWVSPNLTLPANMELDLGGIGKEYAVDQAALQVKNRFPDLSVLINLGGDLFSNAPRKNGQAWEVGIENPLQPGQASEILQLSEAGIATSGDTHRFIENNGKRYGHILNPTTGRPIEKAPRSVTVQAENCTQAGILSTLAMLQGSNAETFLQAQSVRHWVWR